MKTTLHKLGMLMAVLLASLTASAYDFEVDGIYYDVVSLPDLTCEVTKGDVEYTGDIEIPAEVKYNNRSLGVVAIACDYLHPDTGAFYECTSLTSISIPNSITSIGPRTFAGCSSLASVDIPDSVISIDAYAFDGCTSLMSAALPKSLITIGECAFMDCDSLVSVTIPDSVIYIGEGAYAYCNQRVGKDRE